MFEGEVRSQKTGVRRKATRRQAMGSIATAMLAGPISLQAGQHVHATTATDAKAAGGVYKPKALNAHEFETLRMLCEMIVPGASKGGAAEFIDLLSSQNAEMAAIHTGGLAWLDRTLERTSGASFLKAKSEERTALLDKIAYRRNRTPELAAGVRYFDWARRMTVDAYYTSAAGIREVGFKGNKGMAKFTTPQEAIDYAMKRSPFA
jgi:gluconate 2-dehydrogenase gamma chain